MKKREMFRIMAKSDREEIISLGLEIEKGETVEIIKNPEKTLVMVRVKDPVSGRPFYLGEVLACGATVRTGGFKGNAVTMGDDFEKVFSMAVIDGAVNGGLSEKYGIFEKLSSMEKKINEEELKEFKRNMNSKVDFSVMEG